MKKRVNNFVFMFITILLSVSALSLTVKADQPFMQAARNDLTKAMGFLRKATADKGGHRQNAINLVARATNEVNAGIEYDRRNENHFIETDLLTADQRNMQKAKDFLHSALRNLERATADKGGHRQKAMDLIRDAINEVQKGIDYDRRN